MPVPGVPNSPIIRETTRHFESLGADEAASSNLSWRDTLRRVPNYLSPGRLLENLFGAQT